MLAGIVGRQAESDLRKAGSEGVPRVHLVAETVCRWRHPAVRVVPLVALPSSPSRANPGPVNIGGSTVDQYLARASEAGVDWPLPEGWDDAHLETALYLPPPPTGTPRPAPLAPLKGRSITNSFRLGGCPRSRRSAYSQTGGRLDRNTH